ncbi:MAG: hypothetical protein ACAI38_03095 [Myxococcota bacterium]
MVARAKQERGSALVEMTVIMPLVVAVIYGSIYLADLGLLRLKALEVSRYAAWGLATRPLSENLHGNHSSAFAYMRNTVRDEVHALYIDLDAAHQWPEIGVSRLTAGGQLIALTDYDLTSTAAPTVPVIGDIGYAHQLSILGQVARFLGVGPDIDSLVASFFDRLGFNGDGMVAGSAGILASLPWVASDASRALLLAAEGAPRGADLTAWSPTYGFVLGNEAGLPVMTTLLADSWRLQEGYSALPTRPATFHAVVRRLHGSALRALPAIGPVAAFFAGVNDMQVVSRPYLGYRDPWQSGNALFTETGQINVFEMTGTSIDEASPVQLFETGALFDDPNDKASSPYLRELNSRGGNFMGCPWPERRGCR